MNSHIFCIVIFVTLWISACGNKAPVEPPVQSVADTCYNDDPLTPSDSAFQQYPDAQYSVFSIDVSPSNGWWAAEVFINGWDWMIWRGVAVYNPATGDPLYYLPVGTAQWSPDGTKLLCGTGFWSFDIIDARTQALLHHVTYGREVVISGCRWSRDGTSILFHAMGNLCRSDLDGGNMRIVVPGASRKIREFDDTRFVGFDEQGIYYVDAHTGTRSRESIVIPEAEELSFIGIQDINWDISPDRKKILVDINSKSGFMAGREVGGVFLFDLEHKTARKVLPPQYWGDIYRPRWISNHRFHGSYFCRTRTLGRSLSMIWEYDLDGNTIRQVTEAWMPLYPRGSVVPR